MNRTEFLEEMQDVLQMEDELSFDMNLQDIDEWDSLSMMATMAFLNKEFNVKLGFSDLKSFKTVEDIAQKAGI